MNCYFMRMGMVFCIALGLASPLIAHSDDIELTGVTAVVREHFPEGATGGLALLVVKNDIVIHSKGYGLVFGNEPVTPQTPMGLASVAKQFAAMCAAFLIEEGKLSPTDKVSKYLPEIIIQRDGRELLVQDLIWHISGLPNFLGKVEKASIKQYKEKYGLELLNNETHAQWLVTMPLRRVPGVEFEYTNSGYVLLARIVEVVAGKPFYQFQKERIFDVLGMTHVKTSTRFNGSGNMSMPLDDYAKWDRALWEGTLLDADTSKLLLQSGILDNGEPMGYGFGWWVEYDEHGLKQAEHGGSGSLKSNARNWIIRDIRNQTTVALFIRENAYFNREHRKQFAEDIRDYVLRRE